MCDRVPKMYQLLSKKLVVFVIVCLMFAPDLFPVLDLSSAWAVLFLGGSEILIGIVIFNLKQIGLTILGVFHGVLF